MKILCDLDGVVASFNDSFARLLKRINPAVRIDYEAASFPNCWDWPQKYGFTAEDESRAWTEVKNSGVFWRSLFPYIGGNQDLQYLNSLSPKHEIYYVTSRPGKTAKRETEEWLISHGVKLPTVVICNSHLKDQFAVAAEIDIVVEDKPETLLNMPVRVKTVMIERPYNEGYWGYFNVTAKTVREGLAEYAL